VIAVLGGGVAGASLAWSLARRGRRDVVVLDPRPLGSGSTTRAFGGFRTQHGSALNIGLSLAARPFFAARAHRISFRPVGYLYIADSEPVARELERRAELQVAAGLPIEHPEAHRLAPALGDVSVVATNYCALDGVYLPDRILGCLVEEARSAGVDFRYGAEFDPARLEAEAVAVCAGIWSREAAQGLGVSLRVEPLERGVYVVGAFDWLSPDLPVTLDAGTGYHVREREGRLTMIGPGDPNRWDHHREWLARWMPAAAVPTPESHWTGFYEMTFDHHPLVGRTERPGVWSCCGFSGHGVMHAPAVGEALAAMMLGDTPPTDISALDPLRTAPLVDGTQL
jgi:sarcosine oxidase subunit beta